MKKVVLAMTVAAFAGFGTAVADDYDLGAACAAAVEGNADLTAEQKADGCSCLVDGADDAMTAGFKAGGEAAAGLEGEAADAAARGEWTDEGAALVESCFPAAE